MANPIVKKLGGYKQQDKKNEIFSDCHFITAEQVTELLDTCKYTCYYCTQPVKMEYTKREGSQWTLDRIDNLMGHNHGNVLISCLQCNLQRRNRSVKKFVSTKQLIVKKCS
jgi:hypothetical protein